MGPSLNLHILGVGSVSLSLAILKVKATAAIQLGSLMAQARLHIGRVANDPTKLCIKDLPPSEATFGGALTAGMDVQILSGRFVADVTVLGFSVVNPELEWDGLHWHLGSFWYVCVYVCVWLSHVHSRLCVCVMWICHMNLAILIYQCLSYANMSYMTSCDPDIMLHSVLSPAKLQRNSGG